MLCFSADTQVKSGQAVDGGGFTATSGSSETGMIEVLSSLGPFPRLGRR